MYATAAAIYNAGGFAVVAHEPLGGGVTWQADVSVSVTDLVTVGHALLVSGTPGDPSGIVTELRDPSTGGLLNRLEGRPVATNQDESTVVLVDSLLVGDIVEAANTTTGQPRWSTRSHDHEISVGGPSWFGFLNTQTGQVRQLDLTTGRDEHAFVVPASARPNGFTMSGWILQDADSSVYVATDISDKTIVVSGINPTTGAGLWSRRLKIIPLSIGTPVAVSRCGVLVCLTDKGGVTVVDPRAGGMAVLTGASQVFSNGRVWAAKYEVPATGTSVIDAVAYLDPNSLAPGPATEYLMPLGFVGDEIVGLRYLTGTDPAQDAASGSDTAVITMTAQGDQSAKARLSGTHWTCAPAVIRITCISANPATLRVVPGLGS
jgi:hypothetical protein